MGNRGATKRSLRVDHRCGVSIWNLPSAVRRLSARMVPPRRLYRRAHRAERWGRRVVHSPCSSARVCLLGAKSQFFTGYLIEYSER